MDKWEWQAEQRDHRDEYLKTHKLGEEILPVDEGDTGEFAGNLPVLRASYSAAAGVGTIHARVPDPATGVAQWRKQVWFAGEPWAGGVNRVYWYLAYNEQLRRAQLVLVIAPDVQLWANGIRDFSFMPPQHPFIDVFRASSAELVPQLGQPFNIHDVIGEDVNLRNGVLLDTSPLNAEEFQALASYPGLDVPITVKPRQNLVKLVHDAGHFTVRVSLDRPAALFGVRPQEGFVYEVLPASFGTDHRPQITVRVHRTPAVAIAATRADKYGQDLLSGSEVITRLRVETVEYDDALALPPQGSPLSAGTELKAYSSGFSNNARWWGETAEAVLGFVPVLGTALDLCHLAYMSSTGSTYWGEDVDAADIFARSVFCLVGLVADAGDAVKLFDVGLSLFPGVKILSKNPGIVPSLKPSMIAACDPFLLEIIEGLGKLERQEIVDALVKYAQDADLTTLLALFNKHIGDAFARAVISGELPERVVRDALAEIHPADLPGFLRLDAAAQKRILDLMASAPGKQVVDALSGALATEFQQSFDVWRIARALNRSWTGFNVHLLSTGFAKYGKRGGIRNAVQWAAEQKSGQYVAELQRLLGPDFRALLRRTLEYWEMSPSAINSARRLTMRVESYITMRDLSKNLGHWLQADHVVEQRILNHPSLSGYHMSRDNFQCLLVPLNAAVAAVMSNARVDFFYVHEAKTEFLRQIIPHGLEAAFSVSDLFDAHLLVMRYRLGLPQFLVEALLLDEFQALAKSANQYKLVAEFAARMGDAEAVILKRLP